MMPQTSGLPPKIEMGETGVIEIEFEGKKYNLVHTGMIPEGLQTVNFPTRCIEARYISQSKFDRPYILLFAEFKGGYITRIQGFNKHKILDVNSDVAKWLRLIGYDGNTNQFVLTAPNSYRMIPVIGKPMIILPVMQQDKKGSPRPITDQSGQYVGYYITYRIVTETSVPQTGIPQSQNQNMCKICHSVFSTTNEYIQHLEKGCNK